MNMMPTDKVAILIKKAALIIEKMSNHVLNPYELTSTQYKILIFLFRHMGQPVRQADLENCFSLTNPTVTGIIQNLEKKGLVKRVQNPEDKRSKLLMLTETAKAMENELYALGDALEEQVTAGLTNEETPQLLLLLRKVIDNNG